MAGNTAQDLGQLGGVVGSLGVGIGQLAEYAVDGNIALSNLAKTAGPLAAVAVAGFLIQDAFKNAAETKAFNVEQAQEYADAIDDVGDSMQAVVDIAQDGLEGRVRDESILGGLLDKEETIDLIAVLDSFGLTLADVNDAIRSGATDRASFVEWMHSGSAEADAFLAKFPNLAESGTEYTQVLEALAGQAAIYTGAAEDVATKNRVMASSFETINEQLRSMRIEDDPLSVLNDGVIQFGQVTVDAQLLWRQFVDDLADGDADMASTALSADAFAKAMHLTVPEVLALATAQDDLGGSSEDAAKAIENITAAFENQTTAVAEGVEAWRDHVEAVQEASIEVGNVVGQVADVAGGLEAGFGKVSDAFSGLAFDINFQDELDDALDDLRGFEPDIQTVVDRYGDILSGRDIDILGNVRADDPEAIAKIQALQKLVQDGVVNAFEQGGVDAANTFVQSTAATIAASKGISIEEAYRLMGVPEGEIALLIEPTVDAQHADQARAILDSLAGVEGGEAREARIHVALETGQIDGDVAYIASLLLAHEALGINVEPQLKQFTPAQIAEAQAVLNGTTGVTVPVTPELSDTWFNTLWSTPPPPVPVPITLEVPDADAVDRLLDEVTADRRADINVKADNAGRIARILDAVADERFASITAEAHTLDAVTGLNLLANAKRTADIKANATNLGPADAALDGVANRRDAPIYIVLPNAFTADQALDRIADPRYADIFVRTHNTVSTSGAGPIPGSPGTLAATGFAAEDEVGINPLAGESSTVTFGTPVSVAGTSFAPTVHNHVTIQAAVIGSRFDVQRAVTKALRSTRRTNGRRAA
jgi:hypothetical protein